MKTLKTIQTLAKVGKVLSKIVFICSLVGGILCVVGVLLFALLPQMIQLGSVTLHNLIEANGKVTVETALTGAVAAAILCAGEAVLAKLAERYFRNELAAGTPFTLAGAKELMRLGICAICIPLGTVIVAGIVYTVMATLLPNVSMLDWGSYGSIAPGIGMIIASLLCRHGAELTQPQEDPAEPTQPVL